MQKKKPLTPTPPLSRARAAEFARKEGFDPPLSLSLSHIHTRISGGCATESAEEEALNPEDACRRSGDTLEVCYQVRWCRGFRVWDLGFSLLPGQVVLVQGVKIVSGSIKWNMRGMYALCRLSRGGEGAPKQSKSIYRFHYVWCKYIIISLLFLF